MKTQSAKAKGRNLQKLVVQEILNIFLDLTNHDVSSRSMGAQGSDILMSERARNAMDLFVIECKNQEKVNIWSAYKQCEDNAENELGKPLLIIKRNREEPLAILDLTDLLNVLARLHFALDYLNIMKNGIMVEGKHVYTTKA